jgi:N-acetylglucosaminyldiphosphoundecaprenol N-acetyl-beta-D-mannosaminyltransferase
MAEHKDKLSCVMIGVGAAFDFFSGRKKHAPRWMQKSGLEWVFRLASDPKRLWRRYFKHNPRFIWYFGKHWLAYKLHKKTE